jgi:hypothetical protein
MNEPTFLQYDQLGYYTYQCELSDPRLQSFIDALITNKCIKFQSKVFRVLRILLTHPTIVVMKELK